MARQTLRLIAVVALLHGVAARPKTKCGCAKAALAANVTAGSCDDATKPFCGNCTGGPWGCPNNACPFPGASRDGLCFEPGGTHEVCAVVSHELEQWFTSVGNPLSSVVADGGGWCLCKHWTRGALCCYPDTALLNESTFDWSASDLDDPDVVQIQSYIKEPTDKNFCSMCGGSFTAGCPSVLPGILKKHHC
jgi:uncharacterized protein (DUF2237 family)